jgi:hypothetical protein
LRKQSRNYLLHHNPDPSPPTPIQKTKNQPGIVADMNAVRATAWRALADARDLPLPEGRLRHPELHSTPPEVAAVRMLRWADSLKDGR